MIRLILLGLITFCLTFVAAHAQGGKPSTPEDRAKAVEIARSLEVDPLGKHAREQRSWVVRWLIEVPDIHVKACGNFLGPVMGSGKNYESEIFTQMLSSSAAFVIENPDRAK